MVVRCGEEEAFCNPVFSYFSEPVTLGREFHKSVKEKRGKQSWVRGASDHSADLTEAWPS